MFRDAQDHRLMVEPLKGALGFRWEHQGPEGFVQRPPSQLVNRVKNKRHASELQRAHNSVQPWAL